LLVASPIAADVDGLSFQRRKQLSEVLERRVAADDSLHAEAVGNLAFARR
jgi:hypothetical protein